MAAVRPFYCNVIKFYRTNFNCLRFEVPECDKEDFNIDESTAKHYDYFKLSYESAAKLTFNQTEKETLDATKRYKFFEFLDTVIKFVSLIYIGNLIYNYVRNMW